MGDSPDSSGLLGQFVGYDATSRNIEARLKDGTSRIVPATLVTRVYGRGRTVRGGSGSGAKNHGAVSNYDAHSGDPRTAASHPDRCNADQRFNANIRQDMRT